MVSAAIARVTDRRRFDEEDDAMVDSLINRMVRDGESFWDVVYQPFIDRDLERCFVRRVVIYGLIETKRHQPSLLARYHMSPTDARRFNAFLVRYEILDEVVH